MPIHHPPILRIPNLRLPLPRHEIPTIRHPKNHRLKTKTPHLQIITQHNQRAHHRHRISPQK